MKKLDTLYWQKRWKENNIAFHEEAENKFLTRHLDKLELIKGSRIFIPLCGKTRDIAWLLSKGYRVVGIELSEIAVQALFFEFGVTANVKTITTTNKQTLIQYSAPNIDIFVGDVFNLSKESIGHVDAIYDRAALVALSKSTRIKYSHHLIKITSAAPQLLITYTYDQQLMEGPPFSINEDEVQRHYAETYTLQFIEGKKIIHGFKNNITPTENAWLLQKHPHGSLSKP